jgi:hypothetical protein
MGKTFAIVASASGSRRALETWRRDDGGLQLWRNVADMLIMKGKIATIAQDGTIRSDASEDDAEEARRSICSFLALARCV